MRFYGDFPLEYNYANSPNPGYYSFNNRPFMNVHTYCSYNYDFLLKKMVMISNRYTYTFDADRGDWDEIKIPNPANIRLSPYHNCISATPHGSILWITDLRGNGNTSFLFMLDSDEMKWKKIEYAGPRISNSYADQAGAVYDSYRDRLLFATYDRNDKTTTFMAYNFQTNQSEILMPGNSHLANRSELFRESVYIPSLDIILYQIDLSADYKLIYDCNKNSWDSLHIQSAANVGTTNSRSSGYMYDGTRNIIFDCETNCEVYALRLSKSYPEDTVTTAVINANISSNEIFSVFPNPAHDFIHLTMHEIIPSFMISITDIYGNEIIRKHFSFSSNIKLDIGGNKPGIYIIKLRDKDHIYSQKITIIN